MLKNDLVSVIMPTFNRCHTLKRAFDSILKQSYRPIEIVIIDDASQDDTKNFVLMYKKKYCSTECDGLTFTYLRNELNMGIGFSRNRGLDSASGKYIAFLDSDDEWIATDKLDLQVFFLKENNDYGFVATAWLASQNGIETKYIYFQNDTDFKTKALSRYLAHTSTWLLRADLLNDKLFFWNHRAEDLEFLLKIGVHTKCFCIDKVCSRYFITKSGDHCANLFSNGIMGLYVTFLYRNSYPHFLHSFISRIYRCIRALVN